MSRFKQLAGKQSALTQEEILELSTLIKSDTKSSESKINKELTPVRQALKNTLQSSEVVSYIQPLKQTILDWLDYPLFLRVPLAHQISLLGLPEGKRSDFYVPDEDTYTVDFYAEHGEINAVNLVIWKDLEESIENDVMKAVTQLLYMDNLLLANIMIEGHLLINIPSMVSVFRSCMEIGGTLPVSEKEIGFVTYRVFNRTLETLSIISNFKDIIEDNR